MKKKSSQISFLTPLVRHKKRKKKTFRRHFLVQLILYRSAVWFSSNDPALLSPLLCLFDRPVPGAVSPTAWWEAWLAAAHSDFLLCLSNHRDVCLSGVCHVKGLTESLPRVRSWVWLMVLSLGCRGERIYYRIDSPLQLDGDRNFSFYFFLSNTCLSGDLKEEESDAPWYLAEEQKSGKFMGRGNVFFCCFGGFFL